MTLEGNLNANGEVATGASILDEPAVTTAGGTAPTGTTLLTDLRDTGTGATLFAAGDMFTLDGEKGGRTSAPRRSPSRRRPRVDELRDVLQRRAGHRRDGRRPRRTAARRDARGRRGDPNSARLVVTGNVGTENALSLDRHGVLSTSGTAPLTFADGTNAAGFTSNPAGESVHTSFVALRLARHAVTVDVTAVLETKADTGNTWRFFVNSGDDTDQSLVVGNGTLHVRHRRQAARQHRHDDHARPRPTPAPSRRSTIDARLQHDDVADQQRLGAGR